MKSNLDSNEAFDIAFVPINERLISVSVKLSDLLQSNGYTTCILQTAFSGVELSGWKMQEKISSRYNIRKIRKAFYIKKSNFISSTIRALRLRLFLKKEDVPNIKLLIVYMDSYQEGEAMVRWAKRHAIESAMFQEGFHGRESKNERNLYGFFSSLRQALFPCCFTKETDGLLADKVLLWSAHGLRDYLLDRGRRKEDLIVLGNPASVINEKSNTKLENIRTSIENKRVLLLHQPLFPRYASKEWEEWFYRYIVIGLVEKGFSVLFKPHPRVASDEEILTLQRVIEDQLGGNVDSVDFVDRNISSEVLMTHADAGITVMSAGAFSMMEMSKPVYFFPPPNNPPRIFKNNIALSMNFIFSDVGLLLSAISSDFKSLDDLESAVERSKKMLSILAGGDGFSGNFLEYVSQSLR